MHAVTRIKMLLLPLLLLVSLALASFTPSAAFARQDDRPVTRTTIRFVNAVPDTPPLRVMLDGKPVVDGVEFGAASDYVSVEPGKRQIEATSDGGSIATGNPNLDEGSSYIVTFLGQIGDVGVKVNEVKLSALDPGKARIRAINASPDAGELDLRVSGGDSLFDDVPFEEDTEYKEIDAGSFQLDAVGEDDSVLGSLSLEAAPGRVIDLIAVGVVGAQTFTILPIVTNVSPPCSEILGVGGADDACVRIVHGHAALGNADAAIGGTVVASNMSFGQATEFAPIRASEDLPITFVPTGVADANEEPPTVSLKAGQAYVVVAWSDMLDATAEAAIENTQVSLFEIDLTPLPDQQGRVRLIHAAGEVGEIDIVLPSLGEEADLFPGVGEGDATEYEVLDAGVYPLEVHYSGEEAAIFESELELQSGAVYDIVALGNPDDNSFMLLVLTAPAEVRSDTATPVGPPPGATPAAMT